MRGVSKGVIHKNTGSRKVSRLTARLKAPEELDSDAACGVLSYANKAPPFIIVRTRSVQIPQFTDGVTELSRVVWPKPLNRLTSIDPHTPTGSSVYVNTLILWGFFALVGNPSQERKRLIFSLAPAEKAMYRVPLTDGGGRWRTGCK